jgi:ATP-dependent DNA ligase
MRLSKRKNSVYRSGRSPDWLKMKMRIAQLTSGSAYLSAR